MVTYFCLCEADAIGQLTSFIVFFCFQILKMMMCLVLVEWQRATGLDIIPSLYTKKVLVEKWFRPPLEQPRSTKLQNV